MGIDKLKMLGNTLPLKITKEVGILEQVSQKQEKLKSEKAEHMDK